jgi:hypothetical protein
MIAKKVTNVNFLIKILSQYLLIGVDCASSICCTGQQTIIKMSLGQFVMKMLVVSTQLGTHNSTGFTQVLFIA